MTEKTIEREINLSRIAQPKFISLVDRPANQIAFKVVRSQSEHVPAARKTRIKRNDPLMELIFPDTMNEEDINLYLSTYGMEGYSLEQEGDHWKAKKPGYQRSDRDISVTLQQGVKAIVAQQHKASDKEKDSIALVGVEFEKDYYENDQEAIDWLIKNNIDFLKSGINNTDEVISISRQDVSESTEIKRIKLADGVIGLISRADTQNVPSQFNLGVSEAAYGNWGWGQLNFGSYLADVEFSDSAPEAINVLGTVITEILFWSGLDKATRKQLVENATQQFAQYIGSLLDALPSEVVNATRSQLTKELIMTEETKAEVKNAATEEVKAEVVEVKTDVVTEVKEEAKAPEYVTRADMEAAITAAVTAALATISKPAEVIEAATETVTAVQNSEVVTKLEELLRPVVDGVGKLGERLTAVEGRTIVRSDSGDGEQKKKDVFKGAFGNFSG
jgi:hypothetical protein